MTPGARISAVIELLDKIDRSYSQAEEVVASYMRGRRYIGSKDRRFVSETVYSMLRHTAHLNWWTRAGSSRDKMIAYLARIESMTPHDLRQIFDGRNYSPPPLNPTEMGTILTKSREPTTDSDLPTWVRAEFPEWLYAGMASYWGEDFITEAQALNMRAPVDLRVNTLKASVNRALEILKNDGLVAEPTPLSPIGLRLTDRRNIQMTTAVKGGFVEIQDEGSQLISLIADSKAGQKTIDFCAGGGGKTLALAAAMRDGGPLLACDTDKSRLEKLAPRLKRAGVSNIRRHHLTGPGDSWLQEHRASAERVLVDVPCSGSGAWRRAPASKWRLTADALQRYTTMQAVILDQASLLVKPGGRLIYATCSVLPQENEDQIHAFLSRAEMFHRLPIGTLWEKIIGGTCPSQGDHLSLTPARTQTDGFFCAVLEKLW